MMLNSASLATGLSLTTLARAAKEQPQNKTKKPKGFLIGACDWNLGKMSDPGSFAVARQIGLDGVQVSLGTAKNDMHLRIPRQGLQEPLRQGPNRFSQSPQGNGQNRIPGLDPDRRSNPSGHDRILQAGRSIPPLHLPAEGVIRFVINQKAQAATAS